MKKRGCPKGSTKKPQSPREMLGEMIAELKSKKADEVSQGELILMIELVNKIIASEKDRLEITEILLLGLQALSLAIMKLTLENAELQKKFETMQKPFLLLSGMLSGA